MTEENNNNLIKVGKKPPLNYATFGMAKLNEGKPIEIRARGKAIKTAVDISQMIINKFVPNAKVDSVNVGTEKLISEDKRELLVSFISIGMSNVSN